MAANVDLEKQATPNSSNDNHTFSPEDEAHPVSKVYTSGENDQYIMIGRTKVLRSELWNAFGGDLQPGIHATPPRRFANPAPLGLCAFALTTFVLSMINARAMGITTPNIVVGLALFYGGLVQLLAGMWEIALDNTFGGTALSSAYTDPIELANAVSFFLLGWTIFTFMILLCTVKSTVSFFSLFFFLEITFLLLTIGDFTRRVGVTRAGGVFGVITAFIAWYNAFAGIATKENSYITIKAWPLPGAKRA
ncbi:K07034 [Cyberlindnera jadinii]|uniref:K07034 n=1 Tax=Cyberlindnera jadinii (strain ATCC 18201 / CBS 1600 / BCRC 20928 / JCM 3617 / NBRC 0987 / NRRL Y-1542) TaxID=983966 RepID=A0A0H5BYX3_CYBJN|nr:K07034 [Cyberlindnera jadinii]